MLTNRFSRPVRPRIPSAIEGFVFDHYWGLSRIAWQLSNALARKSNRRPFPGGVAASGGQVTLQLPAELSLVSADPPPAATAPLRWDVGALPAQSELQTIRVTLQVAASAAGGSTVTSTAGITSATAELEQANNTAAGAVFVGSLTYLPAVVVR